MRALWLHCRDAEKDQLIADLHERGTLGISEHEFPGGTVRLQAFFEECCDDREWARYQPQWETIAPDESWESRWEPLPVGERFFLVPDWRDDAAPPGRLRLVSHAGPAPGSGYHAPTQLALRAMERVARAADDFLDVGTGAGILAQAAHLLGCRRRVACDIDADSVAVARLVRTPADLFVGSPRSLGSRSFDLVAANLNAVALLNLRRELTRVLRPQGRLILSGFRQPRSAELVGAFGLPVRHRLDCEPWCCVVLVKGADHENRASS